MSVKVHPFWGGSMRNGIVVAQRNGSLSAPLATLTGTDGGQFALPGGDPVIPARAMTPGRSKLRIEAHIRRLTAVASVNLAIRIGASTPVAVAVQAAPAQANQDWRAVCDLFPTAADAVLRANWAGLNVLSGGSWSDTVSPFLNFNADQIVSFGMAAANPADVFILTSFQITLWP